MTHRSHINVWLFFSLFYVTKPNKSKNKQWEARKVSEKLFGYLLLAIATENTAPSVYYRPIRCARSPILPVKNICFMEPPIISTQRHVGKYGD